MGRPHHGGDALMSAHGKDAPAEDIIIVRGKGHEDDHHHGGVWKIAYADFMTAMMAFFLVMWLINAANTETKASVASYFNPIKLTDNVSRARGLLDLDEKANAIEQQKKDKASEGSGKGKTDDGKGAAKKKEGKQAPAAEHGAFDNAAERRHRLSTGREAAALAARREQSEGHSTSAVETGLAFRDPFAPFSSLQQAPAPVDAPGGKGEASMAGAVAAADPAPARAQSSKAASAGTDRTAAETTHTDGEAARKLEADATRMLQQAMAIVGQLGITGGPAIDVTIEGNDIVMSLTDTASFGMFAIGSAEPNELVRLLMRSLTPILSAHGDRIIIRGHTDSRPFRVDSRNSNWRLAMARAEAAYAMLLRSGIDEARFERIEAHADRKPKTAADPEAAANRRIEIIMRRTAS
jgi:chemotaxis protein MotB